MNVEKNTAGTRLRERIGKWKLVMIFGAIYIASQLIIAGILHPLGTLTVLELQTSFSPDTFVNIVQGWIDSDMLSRYWDHFYFDMIHPVWYGLFLCAGLSHYFNVNAIPNKFDFLLFLPFVAGACDAIENISHIRFLLDSESITPLAIAISALACNVKWVLFLGSFLALFTLAIRSKNNNFVEVV